MASEVFLERGAEEIRRKAPKNIFIAPLEMFWGARFRCGPGVLAMALDQ